jgi:hypothetical protein
MRLSRFPIRTLMIAVAIVAVALAVEPSLIDTAANDARFGRWRMALAVLVVGNVLLFIVGVNVGLIVLGLSGIADKSSRK